jgi:hypothetical protein
VLLYTVKLREQVHVIEEFDFEDGHITTACGQIVAFRLATLGKGTCDECLRRVADKDALS